jgi:NAD(P)-dependent dehydrogenase (short-subunit alcohol dehydrogenase family)
MSQIPLHQNTDKEKNQVETSLSHSLQGKVIVISGATSGIGLQAALRFAEQDCFVIGIGRSETKCQNAVAHIRAHQPQAMIHYVLADLSLQKQVRHAAQEIQQCLQQSGYDHIDLLINNAGTYTGKLTYTEEGFERTLAVNHLAPFLLTHELLPLLEKVEKGRVLTVSSGSHYKTWLSIKHLNKPLLFTGLWAYKTTKLCNVLFTQAFNQYYTDTGVVAYAVDPGLVNTNIGFKDTGWLSKFVWKLRQRSGSSPDKPVQTMLHLAQTEKQYNTSTPYWKDSRPKTPSLAARNPHLAEKLWQASRQWCRIE